MKGNICTECFERVIGSNIQQMRSVIGLNSSGCEVCGEKERGIFYARKDELQKSWELLKLTNN